MRMAMRVSHVIMLMRVTDSLKVLQAVYGELTLCARTARVESFNFCVSRARANEALTPGRRA
jgi:hypothetical protein